MDNSFRPLPPVDGDPQGILADVRCFALDMDGTVYLGEKWIEGARRFLDRIEESGRTYLFLTNNSSKDPGVYVEKLRRMGLDLPLSRIVTSGQAAVWYLKAHYPGKRVFLMGNEMLAREFEEEGIELDRDDPEVVVAGFDTSLTYEKLCRVCDLVRAGLPYIATHPDFNCPTETGFIPDTGAMMELIRASAFRYPDVVIGKPNAGIIDYMMERIRVNWGITDRAEVAAVGDRLYTDVAAGVSGGLRSILVLSGEASLEDARVSPWRPDLIYSSVAAIRLDRYT